MELERQGTSIGPGRGMGSLQVYLKNLHISVYIYTRQRDGVTAGLFFSLFLHISVYIYTMLSVNFSLY